MFQANTNSSLKTQVEQLALNIQNQSRNSFLSDTKKNPKDCMTITLRSGKELQARKEVDKKHTDVEIEKAYHNETGNVTPRFPIQPDWRIRTVSGARDYILGLSLTCSFSELNLYLWVYKQFL